MNNNVGPDDQPVGVVLNSRFT